MYLLYMVYVCEWRGRFVLCGDNVQWLAYLTFRRKSDNELRVTKGGSEGPFRLHYVSVPGSKAMLQNCLGCTIIFCILCLGISHDTISVKDSCKMFPLHTTLVFVSLWGGVGWCGWDESCPWRCCADISCHPSMVGSKEPVMRWAVFTTLCSESAFAMASVALEHYSCPVSRQAG